VYLHELFNILEAKTNGKVPHLVITGNIHIIILAPEN
jgi:hypothetical protein